LRDYWIEVAERVSGDGQLAVRVCAGGQLLVRWRGSGDGRRLLLFCAHVDREGYSVSNGGHSGRTEVCIERGLGEIEQERLGAHVAFCGGRGCVEDLGRGVIADISASEPNRALVECESAAVSEAVKVRVAEGVGVSAHHVFVDVPEEGMESGPFLVGNAIDNCAGVAIASCVVALAAVKGFEADVAVLYTVGEEKGFLGALGAVYDWESVIDDTDEVVVVVLDASSQPESFQVALERWESLRHGEAVVGKDIDDLCSKGVWMPSRCAFDIACVRAEDAATIFDAGPARLLYQAAIAIRNDAARGEALEYLDVSAVEKVGRKLGQVGAFIGGFCEGSVLTQWAALRRALGLPAGSGPRVGSIAIPIMNYRFLAGKTVQPEKCATTAVMTAAEMLRVLAAGYLEAWLPGGGMGAFRWPSESKGIRPQGPPVDESVVLNRWVTRIQTTWMEESKRLREWWDDAEWWRELETAFLAAGRK
jgi:putative aminopeptidase FrvX